MRSATLEKKTAAQTGPLHGGSMEYHSGGNSDSDTYSIVSLSAIEKRFPIIARHFDIEILKGAA